MAHNFGHLTFTPAVQALQEKHGSRRQYARFTDIATPDRIGPNEQQFMATRDSFYIASITANGWPYVQHRGGPAGFIKAIDPQTIAFADFRGNKQYITTGNLATNDRVALILVDYPSQTRLKILGHAELLEPDTAPERFDRLIDRVRDPEYKAAIESIFVIHVEAFDWNCQQHITPRFTREQLQRAVAPLEQRLEELEAENEELKVQLARRK
jgi:uncharacterized protein